MGGAPGNKRECRSRSRSRREPTRAFVPIAPSSRNDPWGMTPLLRQSPERLLQTFEMPVTSASPGGPWEASDVSAILGSVTLVTVPVSRRIARACDAGASPPGPASTDTTARRTSMRGGRRRHQRPSPGSRRGAPRFCCRRSRLRTGMTSEWRARSAKTKLDRVPAGCPGLLALGAATRSTKATRRSLSSVAMMRAQAEGEPIYVGLGEPWPGMPASLPCLIPRSSRVRFHPRSSCRFPELALTCTNDSSVLPWTAQFQFGKLVIRP